MVGFEVVLIVDMSSLIFISFFFVWEWFFIKSSSSGQVVLIVDMSSLFLSSFSLSGNDFSSIHRLCRVTGRLSPHR